MFSKTVPYEVVAEDIIQRLMTPLKGFSPDLSRRCLRHSRMARHRNDPAKRCWPACKPGRKRTGRGSIIQANHL